MRHCTLVLVLFQGFLFGPVNRCLHNASNSKGLSDGSGRNAEDVHMDLTMLDTESDRESQNYVPSLHAPLWDDEGGGPI